MRNLALVLTSAFFFSCETDTDIGLDLDQNQKGVYFTDTLSISSGTYQMDSVITSGQNFALIGISDDPYFGKVKAISYLQPTLQYTTQNAQGFFNFEYEGANIVPDSVVLRLWNRNLTYFGDSLSKVTFNVHRLKSSIPQKNYNNDDSVPYDSEILASATFNLQDLHGDSSAVFPLKIKLPESILVELNNLRDTENAKSLDAFESNFKGFVIVPDANSKGLYAFNIGQADVSNGSAPVSSLDYFFHTTGDTVAVAYNFQFGSKRFNQITVNRAGTSISNLTNKKQIVPIAQSNDELFIQAGTGTAAYVKFPGLNSITKGSTISKAELVFEVNKSAFSENFNYSPIIVPIEVKSDGSVRRDQAFGYSYISNTLNQSTGNLGFYNDSLGVIRVDITPYIRELVLKNSADNGVILAAGSTVSSDVAIGTGIVFNGGLNRIILRKPKLELLYSN
ncbi:protein of unknown function [Spirosomataceae bacterium TFI 002]|nr:protein of unknown function [Spirosomataceae bacterium TFI 002]